MSILSLDNNRKVALFLSVFFCIRAFCLDAKETITPIELNHGEQVTYKREDGNALVLELVKTSAKILFTNKDKIPPGESGNDRGNMHRSRLLYEITADVLVNGLPMTMRKYIGSQESFYEPYVINGVRIWFDAVSALFEQDGGFLNTARVANGRKSLILEDGTVRKKARFVLHDMTKRICPGEIHAWFKDGEERDENFIYKENFIDIGRTFNGDDCYLGAYLGGESHGALDIDMAMNSLMYAPFDLNTQEGIRATGTKTWPDGSVWIIDTGHVIEKLVPDGTPVSGGTPYGIGARRGCWWHPHAHFGFGIIENNISYDIDPWIVFWQLFEDNKKNSNTLKAAMEPLNHSKTGVEIRFSNLCQTNNSAIRYYWTFGDGGWSDLPSPEYAYARPGIYPVTLTVFNGSESTSFTQHITVGGKPVTRPSATLFAIDAPSFHLRETDVMDVYGWPVNIIPHTVGFLSRPDRPVPNVKKVEVKNNGGGTLSHVTYGIDYRQGTGWIDVKVGGEGNGQSLDIRVNGEGMPAGSYEAVVSAHCGKALNSPQKFRVVMEIQPHATRSAGVIVDDKDPGFWCTPYFWVGHRFHGWGWPPLKEAEGYNNFYLINGERAREGAFARFTPELEAGIYEVWLYEKTPFASGPPANNEPARFKTRVVHADGEDLIWMEPERTNGFYPRPYKGQNKWEWLEPQHSRKVGEFRFEAGNDGYIEILAEESTGQVIVDAVRFLKINY